MEFLEKFADQIAIHDAGVILEQEHVQKSRLVGKDFEIEPGDPFLVHESGQLGKQVSTGALSRFAGFENDPVIAGNQNLFGKGFRIHDQDRRGGKIRDVEFQCLGASDEVLGTDFPGDIGPRDFPIMGLYELHLGLGIGRGTDEKQPVTERSHASFGFEPVHGLVHFPHPGFGAIVFRIDNFYQIVDKDYRRFSLSQFVNNFVKTNHGIFCFTQWINSLYEVYIFYYKKQIDLSIPKKMTPLPFPAVVIPNRKIQTVPNP